MSYDQTAEELLTPSEIQIMQDELGDIQEWIIDFHAKTINYKKNIYYHVRTDGDEMEGVGEGLYLGKDKDVLIKFYGSYYLDNNEDNDDKIHLQIFQGNPNFLDLTRRINFKEFKELSKKEFPNEENNNELKKMTLQIGYDGIRYHDPIATGEEFVLYNTDKVKLIETILVKP